MNIHNQNELPAISSQPELHRNPDSSKAYSRLGLSVYDGLVVHGFAPMIWDCKPQRIIDHYDQFVSSNHVDIGVGTGYFLDRCEFPTPTPRLALIDQRSTCLQYTARRLARYQPTIWQRDVTKRLAIFTRGFDSLCLGGILHCLAGEIEEKGHVFDRILPLLNPGARVFGYSLVQDGVTRNLSRRWLSQLLNHLRVVSNRSDTVAGLQKQLSIRFDHCRVEQQGAFALFSAIYRPESID